MEEAESGNVEQEQRDDSYAEEFPSKRAKKSSCSKLALLPIFLLVVALLAAIFLPWDETEKFLRRGYRAAERLVDRFRQEKIVEKKVVVEKIVKVPVEKIVEKEPENWQNLPLAYVNKKTIDTAKIFNGFKHKLSFLPIASKANSPNNMAHALRELDDAFLIKTEVAIQTPQPAQTLAELAEAEPNIAKIFPALPTLLENSRVSPYYHQLFKNKIRDMRAKLQRFDRILSRHNFYDCNTILELRNQETNRRVLLAQADMDVVSDGTDGDRMPEIDEYIANSHHFQPFTTYAWPKQTKTPNPLRARYAKDIKDLEEKLKNEKPSSAQKRKYRSNISYFKRVISDLDARSFLIGQADPFVVIPTFIIKKSKRDKYAPGAGDYAAVLYDGKIYPAIVGDAGPNTKIGEASLRIAREIMPEASPYRRPISSLKAYYFYFPDSAEKKRTPPDYELIRGRVIELLREFSGLDDESRVIVWKDILLKELEESEDDAKEDDAEEDGVLRLENAKLNKTIIEAMSGQ